MTVQELLNNESKWTKGVAAKDSSGTSCSVWSPRAVRFCIAGATTKVYGPGPLRDYLNARKRLQKAVADKLGVDPYNGILAEFNDDSDTTFADIQAVIKEANV